MFPGSSRGYQVTETYPMAGTPASLIQADFDDNFEGVAAASYLDGEVSVLLREKADDGEILFHTADWNGVPDNRIDLSELLRLIQFYNSGGLHCADKSDVQSEDGYWPGLGAKLGPKQAKAPLKNLERYTTNCFSDTRYVL